jgi:hypothetical protein
MWKCHKKTPCITIFKNCAFFSFIKSESKRQVLSRRLVPMRMRIMWGKSVRWLIWCKYYEHMHANGKMRPLEIIPEIGVVR